MVETFYEKDADLGLLKEKTIAVLGYGSQGHAQAQNLKDSGLKVIIGLKKDSKSKETAQRDGFEVYETSEAVKKGDIIQVLIPDEVQSEVYKKDIEPNLDEGNALGFSHGFNIHFGQIVPPKNVDVFMVAPKSPGHLVRRMYLEGKGVPGLLAVHQDFSGKAKELGLSYAKGIGCTRAGVIKTTFKEETETDLFGEQAVLCGGTTSLIKAGFETLVEAGYQPEIAYFECLNELKLIVDLLYEGGLKKMRYSISDTAQYGDITIGPKIIDDRVKETMKDVLANIQNGNFAKDWILENKANRPVFNALTEKDNNSLLEQVGEKLRAMMPWIES
ncbi:ketol-acid reductoisomerase [Petrotoga mobilis SJ95]|jgi:ketol-acid reductoisomerase|uniref:Ketol-acid reductoisomerase (NADP(+)) n=1 Tax=Petrotoga mobilis (strain DSM 10674 / SJ95) TaxID=403833 RepID=ILVC_PETMO|nr:MULTISPECIES: ketol-acid reductoisomerase [Petrotoga]A9BGP6.1 RecName: Full=Ketol-acid reductoisomerase (NADP(+)); Short=KARI; AltName: Full=Acetohydroxy-acid isomeroreductase; Short=AHIR; AltName: Full=Alpha-keto-beta-hydroxylacyl reductoisomerase; AltName: Full=Ketol-acid reductoisomerase type 1; AltName: Full=Ketol-acid reductoisomerase type I [Petrotoga mobilis SJ95]ABX32286.1 ketol-acid reductoisomerase [Petrotoga mobilis SJ95]PNR89031.1 ketol-acid reductoisomerase [Petrotoga sp. 9T1HF07